MVPASEERVPAQLQEQDNGIMYTSLGLVSSHNIHCLFDRKTDTMICFLSKSRLKRNNSLQKLMEIFFPLEKKTEISLIPDYYLKELGLKYYKPIPKRFESAPTGWCSWYCYYMGTTEEDMVRETDALAKYLKPYGLEYVQLDACFTISPLTLTVKGKVLPLEEYQAPVGEVTYNFFILIDLRSPEQFQKEHILGALNVPHSEIEEWVSTVSSSLSDELVIYLYSNKGMNSDKTARSLREKGYTQFISMVGGLKEWKNQLGNKFLVSGEI